MATSRRPEHCAPPELFYNEREAIKYTSNSRMMAVQRAMSERAVELLALDQKGSGAQLLLDLGCGSALSGQVLSARGHVWLGVDISEAMLDVASQRLQHVESSGSESDREEEEDSGEGMEDEEEDGSGMEENRACSGAARGCGDLLLADLGAGLPLRAGCCDGAVSVSALQWLCQSDHAHHRPARRLSALFTSLYACLSRGARAVFQFYPENSAQVEMVTAQAMRAGFTGGLVVDFPNSSKAKKVFLVLMTGGRQALPAALGSAEEAVPASSAVFTRRERSRHSRERQSKNSRSWIIKKKERRRRQGLEVARDSRYTGRKRKVGF